MYSAALVSLYDFENNTIFPGVHRSYKFCLLTLTGMEHAATAGAQFVFFAQDVADLRDEERRFILSAADIALLNPNTRTCPIFRSKRDAELTKAIYRRVPVLIAEGPPELNPWGVSFRQGLFNMTSDSGLFRTREQLEEAGWRLAGNRFEREGQVYLPLYEAKMTYIFNHRAASVILSATAIARQGQPEAFPKKQLENPKALPIPRYWVAENNVDIRLNEYGFHGLLGFSDVTASSNERTMLATAIPKAGVGHTMPLIFPSTTASELLLLSSNLNGFPLDFLGRQKLGGLHYTYFILKQLPVLPPQTYHQLCPWLPNLHSPISAFLLPRVLELTYTAYDLRPFAQDCGYHGPPFRWDEERRFLLRCELDAAYFHLYGINREDVAYIMDTFPIVRRKDEAAHGEYRTKRVILEIYDEMRAAIEEVERRDRWDADDAERTQITADKADKKSEEISVSSASSASYKKHDEKRNADDAERTQIKANKKTDEISVSSASSASYKKHDEKRNADDAERAQIKANKADKKSEEISVLSASSASYKKHDEKHNADDAERAQITADKKEKISVSSASSAFHPTPPSYTTRLDPPPAHPDAAHPWDEAYLGAELPRDKWWALDERLEVKDEGGGMKDEGVGGVVESPSASSPPASAVREPAPTFVLQPPPASKGKSSTSPKKLNFSEAQPALVTEFTPPAGGYGQRLKRVMALGNPKNQAELAELVAALGDENGNIRWLAGSSLTKIGGLAAVNLLAAYLQTNPGETARQESLKVLGLIADTSEDEVVKNKVTLLLSSH